MTLPPTLLELLVCPKCKGELEYRQAESVLAIAMFRRLVTPLAASSTIFRVA